MSISIRQATPDDALTIAALHAQSWRWAYQGTLKEDYLEQHVVSDREAVWLNRFKEPKNNQLVLVAESNRELLGFACAFLNEHPDWGAHLDNLHVSLSAHNQGVGRRLLTELAHQCEAQSPKTGLYLFVNQNNLSAQRFYLKSGARNAQQGVWMAPDETTVPTYRFAWDSVRTLMD